MDNRQIVTGRTDIGGTELYYEVAGSGSAIVLLHGHSVDRRMWDAQFESLASRYQVIRYDLRGYGLSDMPQEGKNYLHAEDLYRVLDHLGVKRAHIVGLSLGAFVALDFMHLYPEHALTISIAGGAIYADDEEQDQDPKESAPESVMEERLDRHDPAIQTKVDEWYANLMDGCGLYKEEIREQLWSMICEWSAWTLRHKEPQCLLGSTLTRSLREHTPRTPILVIIGGDDWEGSIRSSEKLLGIVPSARRANIPGAGHFSNMERSEEFIRELELFIKEQGQLLARTY